MPRTKPKSPMRLTMKAFRFAKIALGRVYQKPMSRYDTSPTASQPKKDRKSTRLNSSHSQISYAVFCLKKKKLYRSPTSPARRRDGARVDGLDGRLQKVGSLEAAVSLLGKEEREALVDLDLCSRRLALG